MPEQSDPPVSEFIGFPDYEAVAARCGLCLCAFATEAGVPLTRVAMFAAGEARPTACETLAMYDVFHKKAPRHGNAVDRLREACDTASPEEVAAKREAIAAALAKVFADAAQELAAEAIAEGGGVS